MSTTVFGTRATEPPLGALSPVACGQPSLRGERWLGPHALS